MTADTLRRHRWTRGTVLCLLLILVAEVAFSSREESPGWDEGDHIYAGYMNWTRGEYSLNPEHPPLVKLVATLPLLLLHLRVAPRRGDWFETESYYGGRELLFRNAPRYGGHYSSDTLLLYVHLAVLIFGLLLAVLLFVCGKAMFGASAGLAAMALFVFDPTVLCNAPFVSMDTAAACGYFAAVYAFYRYAQAMTWSRAAVCGLVGLAFCAKFSTLVLIPSLLMLALIELFTRWKAERTWPARFWLRMVGGLSLIAAIALLTVWGVYGFRYNMRVEGVAMPPLTAMVEPLGPHMARLIRICARFHLLPESLLYGLVVVQGSPTHRPVYIFGRLYLHARWFYFPAILSLKWTLSTISLIAVFGYAVAARQFRKRREILFLTLPPLVYLGIAMASDVNIGVRHVLPLFPFAFAMAGAGASWLWQRGPRWAVAVVALLLWHGIASLRMFPNYMPYANVLWGGPSSTHLYFTDSATDWGQQLKWTKHWIDVHHVKDCWFAYYPAPFLLPSDYQIPCKLLPTATSVQQQDLDVPAVVHGPILISESVLTGFQFGTRVRNPYESLFKRAPDDIVADGIAVFYGDFTLPEASAMKYVQASTLDLYQHPAAALVAARMAITIAPQGFDANVAMGDALAVTGDAPAASTAFAAALRLTQEMEPSAQAYWRRLLVEKIKSLPSHHTSHTEGGPAVAR